MAIPLSRSKVSGTGHQSQQIHWQNIGANSPGTFRPGVDVGSSREGCLVTKPNLSEWRKPRQFPPLRHPGLAREGEQVNKPSAEPMASQTRYVLRHVHGINGARRPNVPEFSQQLFLPGIQGNDLPSPPKAVAQHIGFAKGGSAMAFKITLNANKRCARVAVVFKPVGIDEARSVIIGAFKDGGKKGFFVSH